MQLNTCDCAQHADADIRGAAMAAPLADIADSRQTLRRMHTVWNTELYQMRRSFPACLAACSLHVTPGAMSPEMQEWRHLLWLSIGRFGQVARHVRGPAANRLPRRIARPRLTPSTSTATATADPVRLPDTARHCRRRASLARRCARSLGAGSGIRHRRGMHAGCASRAAAAARRCGCRRRVRHSGRRSSARPQR